MQILEQYEHHTYVYTVGAGKVHKKTYYQHLVQVIPQLFGRGMQADKEEELVFLLDEGYFSFFSFDIRLTAKKSFSIRDLRRLIDQKLAALVSQEGVASSVVGHIVQSVQVDGVPQDYVLGKTGDIRFTLDLFVLNPDGVCMCALVGGKKKLASPHFHVYPRNLYVLTYLEKHMHKKQLALLTIQDDHAQLIVTEQGWYQDIQTLNMGNNLLKSCYQEHDVEKYYYTDREEVLQHPFLSKLVDQSIVFFASNLCAWLQQWVRPQTNIVLMGEVNRNPSFMPVFQDSYRAFGQGFVLPFPHIHVPGYTYDFVSEESCVAAWVAAGVSS